MKTHTVKKGDSLWGIAKKYLGDGNRYKEIQKANSLKDTLISPGMVLKIPSESNTNYEEIGKAFEKRSRMWTTFRVLKSYMIL